MQAQPSKSYTEKFEARKQRDKAIAQKRAVNKIILVQQSRNGLTRHMHFPEDIWRNPSTERQRQVVADLKRRGWKEFTGDQIVVHGFSRNIELKRPSEVKKPTAAKEPAA